MALSCTYADPNDATVQIVYADGSSVTVAPNYPGLFRQPGTSVADVLAELGQSAPSPYVALPAPTPDPTPLIYAIGQLQVADGSISALSISSRIAGAFQIGTGSFYVFFTDEQVDTSYLALAYDTGGVRAFVQEADKATDHFIISTTDATGTPADPTVVNFEIKRVS